MSSKNSSINTSRAGGGSAASGGGNLPRYATGSGAPSRAPSNAASYDLPRSSQGRRPDSYGESAVAAYERSRSAPSGSNSAAPSYQQAAPQASSQSWRSPGTAGSYSPYVPSTAGSATPSAGRHPNAVDADLYPVPSEAGWSGKAGSSRKASVTWADRQSWASRAASVVTGTRAPDVASYSPSTVPTKAEEPRQDPSYASLLWRNSQNAAASGSVVNYGRDEYREIVASGSSTDHDPDSERAMSEDPNAAGPWARSEHVPASVRNAEDAAEAASKASSKKSWKSWKS